MDRRELTTPLGFFNVAGSYRAAADKLRVCKLRAEHPHSPILFLYYHSIELYLKAFLRVHGLSAGFLADDIRHNVKKLRKMCVARGLRFDEETEDVLALIAAPGAGIRTRYLEVGSGRHPSFSALSRVCRKIDRAVGPPYQIRESTFGACDVVCARARVPSSPRGGKAPADAQQPRRIRTNDAAADARLKFLKDALEAIPKAERGVAPAAARNRWPREAREVARQALRPWLR